MKLLLEDSFFFRSCQIRTPTWDLFLHLRSNRNGRWLVVSRPVTRWPSSYHQLEVGMKFHLQCSLKTPFPLRILACFVEERWSQVNVDVVYFFMISEHWRHVLLLTLATLVALTSILIMPYWFATFVVVMYQVSISLCRDNVTSSSLLSKSSNDENIDE